MKKNNKNNLKNVLHYNKILMISNIILFSITSIISVSAVSYLYSSKDVSYDNTTSKIRSTDVQGAIDELYEEATNYSSINTRVNNLEGYFKNNPTSYFDGPSLKLGENFDTTKSSGIYLYNGSKVNSLLYSDPSFNTHLIAYDSSGNLGKGTLNLSGNPVQVNGHEVAVKPTITTLLNKKDIPTTATSYSCDWSSYDFLIIEATQYNNIMESMTIPVSYFENTGSGSRPQLTSKLANTFYAYYDVYKNGNNAVYIKASNTTNPTGVCGVRIYGVKF